MAAANVKAAALTDSEASAVATAETESDNELSLWTDVESEAMTDSEAASESDVATESEAESDSEAESESSEAALTLAQSEVATGAQWGWWRRIRARRAAARRRR